MNGKFSWNNVETLAPEGLTHWSCSSAKDLQLFWWLILFIYLFIYLFIFSFTTENLHLSKKKSESKGVAQAGWNGKVDETALILKQFFLYKSVSLAQGLFQLWH